MAMKRVYVAGPFRADTAWRIQQNVRAAEAASLAIWGAGGAALCPHKNTEHFQNELPDSTWLEGDLCWLEVSEAIYMLPNWEFSEGARLERNEAERLGLPVFYDLPSLARWLATAA